MRKRRVSRPGLLTLAILAALGLRLAGANPAVSQSSVLSAYKVGGDDWLDPASGGWKRIPSIEVPLSAQAGIYPSGGGSLATVEVRAAQRDGELYVWVGWDDPTKDVRSDAVERFADAIAIEFPAKASSSVPAVCMGQADSGVNIWQWRADGQNDLAPGYVLHHERSRPTVDFYSEDDRFYPAREVGNPYAMGEDKPVQNLVAHGFGSIGPADQQPVSGRGAWDGRWSVVFSRPFGSPAKGQPAFEDGQVIDVAFAVWNGSEGDRNGKKSVSSFVRLSIGDEQLPQGMSPLGWAILALGVAAALRLSRHA